MKYARETINIKISSWRKDTQVETSNHNLEVSLRKLRKKVVIVASFKFKTK